jgi:hypothetical protein
VAELTDQVEHLTREAEGSELQGRVLEGVEDLNLSLSRQLEEARAELVQVKGQVGKRGG